MSGDVQLRKRNKKTKTDLNDNSNDNNERENVYRLTRTIGKILFFIAFLISLYILGSSYYDYYKRTPEISEVRLGYIFDKYLEEIDNNEFNDFDDNDVEIIGSIKKQNEFEDFDDIGSVPIDNKKPKVITKRNVNTKKKIDETKKSKDRSNESVNNGKKIKNTTTKNNKKQKRSKTDEILLKRIEEAESLIPKNSKRALEMFQKLLSENPNDIRIKYGYGKTLDKRSEEKRSNPLLQNAIRVYNELLTINTVSDELYLEIVQRCVERMRFLGNYKDLLSIHNQAIKRFPKDPKHRNDYAVTLLTMNRLNNAKSVLEETLKLSPNNGYTQVLYGFILKTKDNDLGNAVKYLKSGIESNETGVIDGRFYYHLGDALIRLGRREEADEIHAEAARHKLFLSKNQRSLYNVNRLTSRPFWTIEQTPYKQFFKLLEDNWEMIRSEGLSLLDKEGYFKNDPENLKDSGQWKQLELYSRGIRMKENCKKCPATCKIIESFPDARNCRRGQIKFSVMHPGTHVWPHCGPTNCRIRSHLGLKVPKNTYLRVVDEMKSWEEGKIIIFDDSFEHEVWHNGTDVRLVLIVDVWHPELTEQEKNALPSI